MSGPKLVEVSVRLLNHAVGAPVYATAGAAGADLLAACPEAEPIRLEPGARALAPTGVALALPEGVEAQVRPRSGLAVRLGVTVLNAPGTIDWDYRGEIFVPLINLGQKPALLRRGDRIAQIVLAPALRGLWRLVQATPETARGAGGFGSTGLGAALAPAPAVDGSAAPAAEPPDARPPGSREDGAQEGGDRSC